MYGRCSNSSRFYSPEVRFTFFNIPCSATSLSSLSMDLDHILCLCTISLFVACSIASLNNSSVYPDVNYSRTLIPCVRYIYFYATSLPVTSCALDRSPLIPPLLTGLHRTPTQTPPEACPQRYTEWARGRSRRTRYFVEAYECLSSTALRTSEREAVNYIVIFCSLSRSNAYLFVSSNLLAAYR